MTEALFEAESESRAGLTTFETTTFSAFFAGLTTGILLTDFLLAKDFAASAPFSSFSSFLFLKPNIAMVVVIKRS